MTFTDEQKKQLEERMNRLCTLWDAERKDHLNKCRTLDVAFREATEVLNALGPLLARLEAAEAVIEEHQGLWEEGDSYEAWRKAAGK